MSDRFGSISISPATATPSKPQEKKRPQKKTPRKREKSGKKLPISLIILGCTICVIAIYTCVGFWGVPKYLSTSLPDRINQQSGMFTDLAKVQFNPFTFALALGDIAIRETATTDKELVSIRSIATRLAPISLLRGDLVCKELQVDGLGLNIVRKADGQYNLNRFMQKEKQAENTDFMDFSELPFLFSIHNIELHNSRIIFEDIPQSSIHTIDDIELALPNLSNFPFQADEYIRPGFSAVINGSPVKLTGQTAPAAGEQTNGNRETNLAASFSDIDLPLYFEYLPLQLPLKVTKGKANGTLALTFTPGAKDKKLSVNFVVETSEMALSAGDQTFRLEIPSAKFEGDIQPITGDTHLKSMVLREPSAHAFNQLSLTQFMHMVDSGKADRIDTIGKTGRPDFSADLIIIDDGIFQSYGKKKSKPIETWEAIQLSLKNYTNAAKVDNPATRGVFRIRGEQAASQATFNWQGNMSAANLPAGKLHIDNLNASTFFSKLDISDFSSKSGTIDLQARLALNESKAEKPLTTYSLSEGEVTFHDLSLIHGSKKRIWYMAPITKFTGFSKQGKTVSLGKVLLKNSSITLDINSLPPIVTNLTNPKSLISLGSLDFSGALTLRSGKPKKPELQLSKATLQAIHLDEKKPSADKDNLSFTATVNNSGRIQAKGKVQLHNFSTALAVDFSQIESQIIFPWFSNNALLSQTHGRIEGKGSFNYPDINYQGTLELQAGKLIDNKNQYFSWKSFTFDDLRYTRQPLAFVSTNCAINAPQLNWLRTRDGLHPLQQFSKYLQSHIPGVHTKSGGSDATPQFSLGTVTLSDGTIDYIDQRLTPEWKADITGINGTLKNLYNTTDSEATAIAVTGQLDSIPFTFQGNGYFYNTAPGGTATITLNDYPLPLFHEQLGTTLDIDSSRGDFSLSTTSTWNEQEIANTSELIFSNVEPIAENAATALTLALLTNSDNQFKLSLSSKRGRNAIATPLYTDAITTFQKLMIKASVSPLLLASGNFGDIVSRQFAEFFPGQVVLSGEGRESLARFSSLLSAHPQLGIVVTGIADRDQDAAALQKEMESAEKERISRENAKRSERLEKARQEQQQKIAAARKKTPNSPVIYEADLSPEQLALYAPLEPEPAIIDDAMLSHLANERARVIVDFFISQLALQPQRIKLAKTPRIVEGTSEKGNKVSFSLTTYKQ